jgi:replicative DNA helicase
MSDELYTRRVIPFLKSDYFSERSEQIIFDEINSFVEKYNTPPTTEALLIEIDKKPNLNQQEFDAVKDQLSEMGKDSESPKVDWLIDSTEQFCQERSVYNAVMESIQILDGKTDKTKESIPEILGDALAVSFDTHVGHDYIEDADARFDFYHQVDQHFAFDLEYFNKITNGGLVSKSLNVLVGGPGTGKTLALCHFAASYMTQGKNVLYITLEMAEERISERIDANLLNTSINDLRDLSKEMYDKKINRLKKSTAGKLIVKEYPTAQAGVGHFRHLFTELALKKNFVPDVVIVDYINICTSSRLKLGASVNSYTYIKSIAEEMRGFAVEKNVPLLTATQLNRAGFQSSDVGLENTAESFGLPATADLMLALITTDELEDLNQLMVKQLKNRYNDLTTHKRFVVGVDRTKMRLYDCEQSAQDDIMDDNTSSRDSEGNKFDIEPSKERKDFSSVIV